MVSVLIGETGVWLDVGNANVQEKYALLGVKS